jgi:hypothetical protein
MKKLFAKLTGKKEHEGGPYRPLVVEVPGVKDPELGDNRPLAVIMRDRSLSAATDIDRVWEHFIDRVEAAARNGDTFIHFEPSSLGLKSKKSAATKEFLKRLKGEKFEVRWSFQYLDMTGMVISWDKADK